MGLGNAAGNKSGLLGGRTKKAPSINEQSTNSSFEATEGLRGRNQFVATKRVED
jgi:hypothetical protein